MAYVNGTAADHNGLVAELINFLTTDSGLSSEGNLWTKPWASSDGSQFVMQASGVDGSVPVFVGFRTAFDATTQSFILYMRGMTGIDSGATDYSQHANPSAEVAICLDSNPIEYWIMANNRRVILVAKISTVYESFYAGFFLPYALPTTYAYPYYIAGTRGAVAPLTPNWRSSDTNHTCMIRPTEGQGAGYGNASTPSAYMMLPDGSWQFFSDTGNAALLGNSCQMTPPNGGQGGPLSENLYAYFNGNNQGIMGAPFYSQVAPNLDGGFTLFPLTIVSATPAGGNVNETYGVLEGVYWTPGYDNAAENTVTISGLVHTVFQNVFRSTYIDYFAVAMR